MIIPFSMTDDEARLAEELQLPIYGCDPALNWLGSKTGSRTVFAEESVQHPVGLDVRGSDDLGALDELRARSQAARLPSSSSTSASAVSGTRCSTWTASRDLRAAIELEDDGRPRPLPRADEQGGIVEELIEGEDFRSPSVQLRMSPAGQVDIMSTHDQVLGGAHARRTSDASRPIPATRRSRPVKVGRRLAREGVIGRAAVDFAAVTATGSRTRSRSTSAPGARHPLFALTSLTDGVYDPLAGEWRTRFGDIKHYAATDHLDSPAYQSLTPDDLLDVVQQRGWVGASARSASSCTW